MNYLQQLEASPHKRDLKEALRAQLAKDLGIELVQVPADNLLVWLEKWFDQSINQLDLQQLLYRIDLRESAMSSSYELSRAILEREAQKVIFRAQYSGHL